MMKSGRRVAEEAGVFTHPGLKPGDPVPIELFEKCRLPASVGCSGCGMSMWLIGPNCLVDARGYPWCPECAGLYENEPTKVIPKDDLETLVAASGGRPDYFENEVDPIVRVRQRFLMGLDPHEVTAEEEYDILRDMLEIALLDRTVSHRAKPHIRDVLHITFSAPQHQAWEQALSEIWGLLEGSLADPERALGGEREAFGKVWHDQDGDTFTMAVGERGEGGVQAIVYHEIDECWGWNVVSMDGAEVLSSGESSGLITAMKAAEEAIREVIR